MREKSTIIGLQKRKSAKNKNKEKIYQQGELAVYGIEVEATGLGMLHDLAPKKLNWGQIKNNSLT